MGINDTHWIHSISAFDTSILVQFGGAGEMRETSGVLCAVENEIVGLPSVTRVSLN